MKAIVSLFLSTWLMFEPMASAAAVAKTNRLTLLEQGLRDSGFATREVSLSEFVTRYGHVMPPAMREMAFEILKEDPDFKLPKYSVQKTKTGLQISFVGGGASGSLAMTESESDVTTQIGQEKIRFADWMNAKTFTNKLAKGFSSKTNPNWITNPNRGARFTLVSAKTLKGLDKKDREAYLTKVRNYLEALEKAQNKLYMPDVKKSAGFFHALVQEAFAAESASSFNELRGKPCIAGGNLTEWQAFNGQNITCGGNDVVGACRESSGGRTILCNKGIYGSSSVAPKACVPSQTATQSCNQLISVPDSFRSEADYRAYDDFRRDKTAKLQEADRVIGSACNGAVDAIGPARLRGDQSAACDEFNKRRADIEAFDCHADSFKQKYPKLTCEGGGAGPAEPGQDNDRTRPPGGEERGGAGPAPGGPIACDKLGLPFIPDGYDETCAREQRDEVCLDPSGQQVTKTVRVCICDSGRPGFEGNTVKCIGEATPVKSKKGAFGKWWKKNSKWVAMIGGGLIMLWAYNYMFKKSVERNYELNIPVTTTLPAVEVPPTNPQPIPRDGTQ